MPKYTVTIKSKNSGRLCPANFTLRVNGKLARIITGRSGGYRLVALTAQGHILKIDAYAPRTEHAFERQTRTEKQKYREISKEDRKYFPKIIAKGTVLFQKTVIDWVIQEKLEFEEYVHCTKAQNRAFKRIAKRYDIGDIETDSNFIGSFDNLCITTDGRPIIYDWGVLDTEY